MFSVLSVPFALAKIVSAAFAEDSRFYKTPVDQFVERMAVLVDRGRKHPESAFHLCVVEKEFKNQTAILEQQVAHDQVRSGSLSAGLSVLISF